MLNVTVVDIDSGGAIQTGINALEPTVWRNQDGTVCAYVYSHEDEHLLDFPGIARFRFRNGSEDTAAIRAPSATPDLVLDTYRRIVLPMRLQQQGTEVLHASAVVMGNQVVALCAVSGTGKSTTAFALTRRGYPAWADDVIAFRITSSCVEATPLPFRVRLRRDAANFLDRENAELYSKTHQNDFFQLREKVAPLGTIIVLKRHSDVNAPEMETFQLSPDESFRAVLSHAWCFTLSDRERKRSMMKAYMDLVAMLAVYEIRYCSGLERLGLLLDCIESLVASRESKIQP
jgi:hypothetical protein